MRIFFAVKMWCRRQAAAAILPLLLTGWLTGESSEALTTFGKSNTQPPKDLAPTPPPGTLRYSTRPSCKSHRALERDTRLASASSLSPNRYQSVSVSCDRCDALQTRPCSKQAECAGITSSSCVRTHYDPVTRCLCGDNLPPVNGQCEAPTKTLYHVCANSDECNDGLICGAPNITSAAPAHMRVFTPQDKICLCDTENGYKEKEHACNDAVILKISLFAIIFVSCLRKLIL